MREGLTGFFPKIKNLENPERRQNEPVDFQHPGMKF